MDRTFALMMASTPLPYRMGGVYCQCTPDFNRGPLWNLSRTIRANMQDAGILIEYDDSI